MSDCSSLVYPASKRPIIAASRGNFSKAGRKEGSMSKPPKGENGDASADNWSAFERAVDVVVKAPPQHRTKTAPPKPKKALKKPPEKRA
jgi:hypothetical protein